jgi:hypothetical protein
MARPRGWGDAECISNGEARVVPWRRLVRRFVAGRAVLEVAIQESVQNSCGMDQACDPSLNGCSGSSAVGVRRWAATRRIRRAGIRGITMTHWAGSRCRRTDMQAQGRKLIHMIGLAVHGPKTPDTLIPAVQELGK